MENEKKPPGICPECNGKKCKACDNIGTAKAYWGKKYRDAKEYEAMREKACLGFEFIGDDE
jgi:hypothetical protein